MDEDALSPRLHHPVQLGDPRLDELPPQRGAHDEPPLLPPVISEAHPVDIEGQRGPCNGHLVLEDTVEKRIGEWLVPGHGHEDVLHSRQRPGPFEKREGEGSDGEALPPFFQAARKVLETRG